MSDADRKRLSRRAKGLLAASTVFIVAVVAALIADAHHAPFYVRMMPAMVVVFVDPAIVAFTWSKQALGVTGGAREVVK